MCVDEEDGGQRSEQAIGVSVKQLNE